MTALTPELEATIHCNSSIAHFCGAGNERARDCHPANLSVIVSIVT